MAKRFLVVPKKEDFLSIKGKINEGIQLRCGTCHCQCPCNCPSTCQNCKKHVDAAFIRNYSSR